MCHKRILCLIILVAGLCLSPIASALPIPCPAGNTSQSGQDHDGATCSPDFNYALGPHGPAHWGGTCNTGKMQAPIDIRNAKKASLPPLAFAYEPASLNILNDCNHYTVKINYSGSSSITFGNRTYKLKQFHFHEPSEEAIDGNRASMVVHLVHEADDKSVAVVAALVQPGEENKLITTLLANLPPKGEKREFPYIKIDPTSLLPADRSFYMFAGSLTTPKCDEGVTWFVLKKPIYFSQPQIDAYKKQYSGTARPLQPLNGRTIEESK